MSTQIDDRVVEMRFDNRQFEDGVKTSLSTLDKLKQALKLDGAAKGLDGLSDSAKKCDVSMLGKSVEMVSTKFSALETIAVGALLKIGNQAVTTGERLLKSLTVDNIAAGWDKLAKKTTSVGTLVAQGYDMSTVEEQLERLNWFTDETSYNFTDMVESIAKFTASGQTLEGSVTALEGVATWAALSGQNASKASMAMYQLSQAMGAGVMRKEDYKSIQNLSMDTVEFRRKALEAGVALGTLRQNADGTYHSLMATGKSITDFDVNQFAEHLTQDAWFTSDVMMKVFNDYSAAVGQIYDYSEEKGITASEAIEELGGAVDEFGLKAFKAAQEAKTWEDVVDSVKDAVSTGWMKTFELIFGNYEEQRVLWTDMANSLYDIFAEPINARNEMLSDALKESGFDKFTSVVKDAGIEMDSFHQKLAEVAEKKGISLEDVISEYGSLEKAVQNGAISYDMLRDATILCARELGFDKLMLSELRDGLDATSDDIDKLSGRQHLVAAFWNTWEGVGALLSTVRDAFRDIFPATTAEQVYNFAKGLNEVTEKFKLFLTDSDKGQALLENLKNTFKGMFAVLDIVKQAFSALWRALSPTGSAVGSLISGIIGITGTFGEWIVGLDEAIKKNDTFYKVIKKVVDFISGSIATVRDFATAIGEKLHLPSFAEVNEGIRAFFSAVNEKIGAPGLELLNAIFDNICKRADKVKEAITGMKNSIVESIDEVDGAISNNKFSSFLTGIWNVVKSVAGAISDLFGNAISKLIDSLNSANFDGIIDFLNLLVAGGMVAALKKFLDPMNEMKDSFGGFIDWAKGLGGGVTKILDGVRGSLQSYQENLKASTLLKIAGAIGILAASLLVLSSIDSEKLTVSLAAIGALFIELIGAMAIIDKLSIDSKGINKTSASMIKMGAALLILSFAVKNIADLEPERLGAGILSIGVLLAELAAFTKVASFDKNMSKTATSLVVLASALLIMTKAVEDLAGLSWDQLGKGLAGVGALLAEVAVFLNLAKFSGKSAVTAAGIVLLSAAIKVLASACKDFGSMSWDVLEKGLESIGLFLAEMAVFTNLTGNAKHVTTTGIALIAIAGAMKIFASATKDFGSMPWDEIEKGLVGMGVALAAVAVAANLMPKNMVVIGVGLIAVGAALNIFATALGTMGGMSWEAIGKGLLGLGVALVELSVGLMAMNGSIAGAAALVVAAAGLAVLAPVLQALGSMSWESIAKGLVAIAGGFAVIGIAAAVLTPLVGAIAALSGALILFGASAIAIGAGLTLIGAGLSAIAVGLTALAASWVTNISVLVKHLGSVITAVCEAVASAAPAIAKAIKEILLSLIDVFVECIPALADGALRLVIGILNALADNAPMIVDAVMRFIIGIIEGIADNMPQLIQAVMDLIGSFFSGIISALGAVDADGLIKGIEVVGLLTGLVAALGLIAGLIPSAMVGVLGLGVVVTELALVLAAVGGLAQIPGLDWLISEGGNLLQTIGTAIGGFVGGIVGGFMSGVSSSFPQIGADLAAFMTNVQPFITGASSITPDMLTGIMALTDAIMLITAADLVESITSWLTGGASLADFGEQLVPFGESMVAFSDAISGLDAELVDKTATAAKTLAEMAATLPTSGGVVSFFSGENDMTVFGDQLYAFGNAMTMFGQSIAGLDAEAVQNAAIAGQAMANMAATIPNCGGVVAFFAGENDLATFGDQLVAFGTAMKRYSTVVAGINPDVVTASATAGQALVNLAKTVPNSGGAISFFMGDNDLATFGGHIVAFGVAMKNYSAAVSGLNTDVVTNSATAGAALVELANTVPNTGGLIDFFTGSNDLGTFGVSIVKFGIYLSAYSEAIKDVSPEVVTASANAAKALSELATGLPNVSLFDEWFGGNQTLAQFGRDIAAFGKEMSNYYSTVSGIDLGQLSGVISQVWSLVHLAQGTQGIDTSGMSGFGAALSTMATNGITQFVNTFNNCGSRVSAAVGKLVTAANTAISGKRVTIGNSMSSVMNEVSKAITSKKSSVTSSMGTVMSALKSKITSYKSSISSAMKTAMSGASSAVSGYKSSFRTAGANAGQGLIDGIISKKVAAYAAGRAIAISALDGAKNALAINSPSKEFIYLGESIGEGFEIGINNSIVPAGKAASNMSKEVINQAGKGLESFEKWLGERKYYNEIGLTDELAGWEALQKKYKEGSEERMKIDREVYRVQNELVAGTYKYSTDWIENEKYYKRMSTEEELAAYKRMQKRYKDGSDERKEIDKKVFALENQLIDEAYEHSMDWIDEKKYYGQLSLEEELAAYERIQSRYEAGSEEWKKMEREKYRVRNEIVKDSYEHSMEWIDTEKYYNRLSLEEELAAYERVQSRYAAGTEEWLKMEREKYRVRNEIIKESYDNSMNWIEEEKYYGRMTLTDELAAYKRVQNRYAKGTEERKKADREVYRLEKEIYDAQKKYIDDVQKLQTEANEKRYQLEKDYNDKVKSINEKLASDIDKLNDKYQSSLESRANSLYQSYGLFDEVKEREEVSGTKLLDNLQGQVEEFGEWQRTLDSLSAKGVDADLLSELTEMGPSALAQLKALESLTKTELDRYVDLWRVKHVQARDQATKELEGLHTDTINEIEKLRLDAKTEIDEAFQDFSSKLREVDDELNGEMEKLRKDFGEQVGLIKKDAEKETQEMVDAATAILTAAGWDEIGRQIVAGIREGITDESSALLDAITQTGIEMAKTFELVNGINSPSKVFRELGNYTMLGLIKGITDYADKSYDATETVGENVRDGLSDAIKSVSDFLNGDMDILQPTIRPVLDLSDVSNGFGTINGLLYNQRMLALAGQTSYAFSANAGENEMIINVDNASVVQEIRYLRGEMADMTERITRMQVVLDTGTLVGETADMYDSALGQKQLYRGRRI